jgi:probable F420-dependent oxidoreductase
VKVRIGLGLGRAGTVPGELTEVIDAISTYGLDSLWLSEQLTGNAIDPIVGLSFAACYHQTLKLGTTMLLPGRNVVRLAKQLATLDSLSAGRLLVTFVPGVLRTPEREAIGVAPRDRGAVIDEMVPLLRRLLNGETIEHDTELATLRGVHLSPLPVQQPLEFWLGGMAPAALERCGRIGDGWLPSLCTPEEAAAGRAVIERSAFASGREISPEHYGVSIGYATGPLGDEQLAQASARAQGRRSAGTVPQSLEELRTLLESFIAVGFSKFVVRPIAVSGTWGNEIALLSDAVGDLQS